MAAVVKTARVAARTASRCYARHVVQRGFQNSSRPRDAQNYAMPALSPTMTEGNIANWRVKEGESFSAGDVLLEIETDKATMDVEAQDDGIVVKITMPDGSKGVKVGQRIAVTAEPGDDISSLEIPADNSNASSEQSSSKQESVSSKSDPKSEENQAKTSKEASDKQQPSKSAGEQAPQSKDNTHRARKYPLYPSVEHLLHQNGISEQQADDIPASGPGGRLLKGDVLAYVGQINKDYPAKSSARLEKLSHLDLSNIQLAPKQEAKSQTPEAKIPQEPPRETEIALPISLSAVLTTQKRVKDTLGIHVPLATFISRASTLANDDLPVSKKRTPTADELFNAVLGLDTVPKMSRGDFFPDVLESIKLATPPKASRSPDIIDFLAPKQNKRSSPKAAVTASDHVLTPERMFAVVAEDGDEARATEYLQRMKFTLEENPGMLVLS